MCCLFRNRFGNLAGNVRIHLDAYFLGRKPLAQEEHQFGDGTFRRAVVSADQAGIQEWEAGFIKSHVY